MRFHLIFLLVILSLQSPARIFFIDVNDKAEWKKFQMMADKEDKDLFLWFSFAQPFEDHFDAQTIEGRLNKDLVPIRVYDPSLCQQIMNDLRLRPYPGVLIMNPKGFIGGIQYISEESSDEEGKNRIELTSFFQEGMKTLLEYPIERQQALSGNLPVGRWEHFLQVAIWNESPGQMENLISQLRLTMNDSSLADTAYWPFILKYNLYLENPIVKTLMIHPELVENEVPFPWNEYITEVYRVNLGQAIQQRDSLFMERVILEIDSLGPDTLKLPFLAERTRLTFLRSGANWNGYKSVWNSIPDTAIPYSFYESEATGMWQMGTQESLETSLFITRKGVDAYPTSFEFAILRVYALYENGMASEALKMAYRARDLADTEDQYRFSIGLIRQLETPVWDYYEN